MKREFWLSAAEADQLTARQETPFLVASVDQIEENYRFLRRHLPHAGVYYAIKANPEPAVLRRMAALGTHFDVASAGEMEMLAREGVAGDRMIYANTVKDFRGLRMVRKIGLHRMTFDAVSEIGKMSEHVPGADVLVRICVKNNKALVDLNTKFGAAPEDALPLLRQARDAGLHPVGICFHVGSQSLSAAAYEEALLLARALFDKAESEGMHLTDLDIGGGFPVPDAEGLSVDVAGMLAAIDRQIARLFPDTAVWCEPGRFIPGTAANLLTTVIGVRQLPSGTRMVTLDDGLYGALSGILFDHWQYPMHFLSKRGGKSQVLTTLVGPSCDGIDVVARDILAPELSVGDHVLFGNIGAYASVSETRFNGFSMAPTLIWEEQAEAQRAVDEPAIQKKRYR